MLEFSNALITATFKLFDQFESHTKRSDAEYEIAFCLLSHKEMEHLKSNSKMCRLSRAVQKKTRATPRFHLTRTQDGLRCAAPTCPTMI